MNLFSDWYIFNYIPRMQNRTIVNDYLIKNHIGDVVCESFANVNYSLFEFYGKNLRGKTVLKDLLHNEKIL